MQPVAPVVVKWKMYLRKYLIAKCVYICRLYPTKSSGKKMALFTAWQMKVLLNWGEKAGESRYDLQSGRIRIQSLELQIFLIVCHDSSRGAT